MKRQIVDIKSEALIEYFILFCHTLRSAQIFVPNALNSKTQKSSSRYDIGNFENSSINPLVPTLCIRSGNTCLLRSDSNAGVLLSSLSTFHQMLSHFTRQTSFDTLSTFPVRWFFNGIHRECNIDRY
jgi:hypothetical protein